MNSSTVICEYTGIIISLQDNATQALDEDLVFTLNHPLSKYSQVVKSFKYKTTVGNNYKHLLAGAIISTLRHHSLLRIHSSKEALIANNEITKQAKSSAQLLALLHRLLNQEDRLATIGHGIKVKGEKFTRYYQFCLEACQEQGQEFHQENKYFLANLTAWINELLPPTVEELIILDNEIANNNKQAKTLDGVKQIQLDDGRLVEYDDVVEAVRNRLEDDIFRRARRMPTKKLNATVRNSLKLMASDAYGNIFTDKQYSKLSKMISNLSYNKTILQKAIEMVQQAAVKEANQQRRNKMFECVAWLKASDLEYEKLIYTEQAFEAVLEADLKGDGVKKEIKQAESLQDRLTRLQAKGGK